MERIVIDIDRVRGVSRREDLVSLLLAAVDAINARVSLDAIPCAFVVRLAHPFQPEASLRVNVY